MKWPEIVSMFVTTMKKCNIRTTSCRFFVLKRRLMHFSILIRVFDIQEVFLKMRIFTSDQVIVAREINNIDMVIKTQEQCNTSILYQRPYHMACLDILCISCGTTLGTYCTVYFSRPHLLCHWLNLQAKHCQQDYNYRLFRYL